MTSYQNLRKIFIGFFLLMNVYILKAQLKPDATTAVPNATGTVTPNKPPDYTSADLINYIRVWQPQFRTTLESDVISTSRPVDDVNVSTQYFDGLARPLQTVNWQASPGKQDIVAPVVYDAYGREQYKFLPYTSPTASTSGKQGQFKVYPFTEQSAFYTNTYKTEQPAITNEKYFYSKTNFEPSPLNRVSDSYAPGNSWAGSEILNTNAASEKKVSVQYLVNTGATGDNVQIWTIGFNTIIADNTNIPTSSGAYATGQLYKTVTLDEAGNAVVEYKDNEGQVILKKVQIGTIASDFSGYTGFLCTYYVYDDLNQLRTVIQPKAVAAMITAGNWTLSQTIVNELCFRYEYDYRQRMIAKKVPGSQWIYMVYDLRDRVVFSQDGNMRSKSPQQWTYTLYDDINRPVQTGIMTYTGTWANLVSSMPTTSSNSTQTNSGTNQNINPADMYINSRETGRATYQATNSIIFDIGFISEDNASFVAQITSESASTFSNNATVNTYPIPTSGATLYPLTYTYYDDYTATTKTYNNTNNSKLDDGGNLYPETLPTASSAQTKGMVTVTKVRVIEDPTNLTLGKWLETADFYDDKGRVIQVQNTNYKGGIDILTNRYDFTNKVVSSYLVHNNVSGNVNNLRVLTSMNYDHAGRLKTITKTINDDATNNKRVVATNIYDALGQVKEKKTGQKSATDATPLEDDNYNYNIRGWLKDINYYSSAGAYASQMSATSNKWFSMDLSYDWGFSTANQYNGNISGTRWKTAGDGQERAYGFAYDAANRLLKGDFTQNNSGWNTTAGINFSMQVGDGVSATSAYDENGNIKFMQQYGLQVTTSAIIDKMTYLYKQTNQVSNQLLAVTEDASIGNTDHKLGDFTDKNTSANDYDYDANGNLLYDKNKKITLIEYNHLNLPWRLTVQNDDGSSKGTIMYIYDAAGNKLEKRTTETASTYNNNVSKQTTTSYLGSFIYENNVLQFFGHEDGRVRYRADNNTYVFDYFVKDHLGNVRMVLTDQQQIDHYPTATLEGSGAGSPVENEKAYYDINNSYVQNQPSTLTTNYINDNGTNNPNTFGNRNANSLKMYKLNAATNRTGLGMVLQVTAGDKINILGKSYYHYSSGGVTNTTFDASALISAFLSVAGVNNVAAVHGATTTLLNANTTGTVVPINTFTNNNPVNASNNVKAGIAYILFDAQFKYAGGGFDPVDASASGALKSHMLPDINVPKNGYIYIYCSNESNIDVFFDNLEVIDTRGPLIEETHYYPFGLTMAGISSKAAGELENKIKFQKQELQHEEFSDGSGLEMYEFKYRMDDPQIGRFWQIDPLADKYNYNSTYAFSENRVINGVELEGKEFEWFMNAIAEWIVEKQSDYSEAVRATGRLARGTSGEVNQPGGSDPAVEGLQKTTGTLQDIVSASKPYIDVIQTTNTIGSFVPFGEAGLTTEIVMKTASGVLTKNLFTEGMSSVAKGELGEQLTKSVLQSKFKGATIIEQGTMKLENGSTTYPDFVVVKDNKVVGVFESKVNGSKLSSGQSSFYTDGMKGTLSGPNVPKNMQGVKVDPSKVNTGVYRWDSKTGSYLTQ